MAPPSRLENLLRAMRTAPPITSTARGDDEIASSVRPSRLDRPAPKMHSSIARSPPSTIMERPAARSSRFRCTRGAPARKTSATPLSTA
eukprot:6966899-Prymnesium_polylepis.1